MNKKIFAIGTLVFGIVMMGASCGTVADGGVFRSSDEGQSWEQKVFVGQQKKKVISISSVNVQKLVQDPNNSDVLYLATKEDGLWKTETKGEQWYQLPLTPDRIRDVAISLVDSNVVFTVRGNTILKTVDGGGAWDIVYTDSQNAIITRIVVDWFNGDQIYAVTSIGTVLFSEDAGANWQVLTQVDEPLIGITMSQLDSRVLYITELDRTIHKTVDGGVTWADIFAEPLPEELGPLGIVKYLTMSPSNSNELYLVTTEGIFNSQDGGSQWNYVTTLIARGAPENSAMTTFAVRPDAAGTLLFTVGRIIHKTVDGGITWETIETFPSGRKITSLLVDTADPNTVFAGTELVEEKKKGLVSAPSK